MKVLVLLFLTMPVISLGQGILIDFETDELNDWYAVQEGRWCIENENALNGNGSLRHCFDNENAGEDWISYCHAPVSFQDASACWEFKLRYEYAPSSNNHWAVLLSDGDLPADEAYLSSGMAIGVNLAGNLDELMVWEIREGEKHELLNTGINWQEEVTGTEIVKFSLHCIQPGQMKLEIGYQSGLKHEFSFSSPKILTSFNIFSLFYKYSSSYDQGLWLDDLLITGEIIPDTIAPYAEHMFILSPGELELVFSEAVKFTPEALFCIAGKGCFRAVESWGASQVFNLPFELSRGEQYLMILPDLEDLYGIRLKDEDKMKSLYYPDKYDLLISEIMADPSPTVLLPDVEYIELQNRSSHEFSIKNWALLVNGRSCNLPEIKFHAADYGLLIRADELDELSGFSKLILLPQLPSLRNSDAELVLLDATGSLMHAVHYSDQWHRELWKREGGWSLEMADCSEPCMGGENWKSSEDPSGGTPGRKNSTAEQVMLEYGEPELWRVAVQDSCSLILYFSEGMDSSTVISPTNYKVDHDIGYPERVISEWPIADKLYLTFGQSFQIGIIYKLDILTKPEDCTGRELRQSSCEFALPGKADTSAILINEILFDPTEGMNEFVELYNPGDYTIDLKEFRLTTKPAKGRSGIITNEYWPLKSGEYAIVAKSYEGIDQSGKFDEAGKIVLMPAMPSLNNSGGQLYLYFDTIRISDIAAYDPDWHHQILASTKQVSLERVATDISGLQKESWHSASSDAGYMTPAARNSQEGDQLAFTLNLSDQYFDPSAGQKLEIAYKTDREGYVAQVMIFDIRGVNKRVLGESILLGGSGKILYNGRDKHGEILPDGYYILFFKAYHQNAQVFEEKRSFLIKRYK